MNTPNYMARMLSTAADATAKPAHNLTSQCLEIAGWSHADCVADWCRCDCGHEGRES